MIFKKLSDKQLAEYWNQIEEIGYLLKSTKDPVKFYGLVDELEVIRRKFQRHWAACAMEGNP